MVFPISDAPNPRGSVPLVTMLLIAINVGVYVLFTLPLSDVRPASNDPRLQEYLQVMAHALGSRERFQELLRQISSYDLFVFVHGFRPAAPSIADMFTSMFLHAGFMHLFGNMLFLWIYGDNVEHRLGHLRYLIAYLATGAAAILFHLFSAPDSGVPMIGASGAISGVLGFYFLFFPRNQVRLLWLLPPFLFQTVEVPARIVLGFYLVMDNLLPYLFARADVGVAHGAHIGGFIAGLAAAWWMRRREVVHRPAEYASEQLEPRPIAESIGAEIARGEMAQAARSYFALPANATRRLLEPQHSLELARWLRENGHHDAALVVLRRHLRDFPNGPGLAEASERAGEILLEQGQEAAAYQYFVDSLSLDPDSPVAERARAVLARIESRQKLRAGRAWN